MTASYIGYRTREKIVVDGRLDEKVWQLAPKSPRFADVVTGGPALYANQYVEDLKEDGY